ncbi:biotin--[acetyl-CoA-carboxylase] ligase [Thioalkalivibrio denitrificans]|uniref:biotin--[biotin carboxyl-carrier protein] ligase n=2 Tax=Thioalkalivibrio denitrificans TaxID=108003 RepID=A0A1V3NV97_9GAMM|nr:biotin--[acetyl-CoA-carboxylase] ligase [Thioalkalivibrio denitrificans]
MQDAADLLGYLIARAERPGVTTALPLAGARLQAARQVLTQWGMILPESASDDLRWPAACLPPLEVRRIEAGLSAATRRRLEVHVHPVVDSTNAWVAALPHGDRVPACLAEYQTAGRGRRGRGWHMPPGSGIAMSLRWDVSAWTALPPHITLALGLSVARALHDLGVTGIRLKWPNDFQVDGRKLGGMLVENRQGGQRKRLIVGLGINVRVPGDTHIDQPWTDLETLLPGGCPGREHLAAVMLDTLVRELSGFPGRDPASLPGDWARFDALASEPVRAEAPGGAIEGIARGIDPHGRLRVETAQGVVALDAGDVRVRRRRA